jgi:hypothetical protein
LTDVLVLFMATPSEKHERQDRILAEILELALDLARSSQARALAAEDAAEAAHHGLTFQRAARSVRQTLALEAKFERDRKTAERADHDVAERAKASRAERRKAQVKLAVERCVWSEADGDEAEKLLDGLDDILESDTLAGTFAGDDAIEVHVARVCAELGVDTPETLAARRVEAPSASSPISADTAPEPQVQDPQVWRSSG